LVKEEETPFYLLRSNVKKRITFLLRVSTIWKEKKKSGGATTKKWGGKKLRLEDFEKRRTFNWGGVLQEKNALMRFGKMVGGEICKRKGNKVLTKEEGCLHFVAEAVPFSNDIVKEGGEEVM